MMVRIFILPVILATIFFPATSLSVNGQLAHPGIKNTSLFGDASVGFIENQGQYTDDRGNVIPEVLFKAAAKGVDIYITTKGITYVFTKTEEEESSLGCVHDKDEEEKTEWCRLDMELVGAKIKKENVQKEQGTGCLFNYFLGHCPRGILNVEEFRKITIGNIYPGIDWVLYSNEKGLKYDFVVQPGADYSKIRLLYHGAENIFLESEQQLKISTPFGEIQEGNLYCYEKLSNREVQSSYKISALQESTISEVIFQVNNYNPGETLVIDPPLVWATYYGGNGNGYGEQIENDPFGNIFVTGTTSSNNFPVANSAGSYFQGVYGGNIYDAFIVKFDAAGVRQWATYYGGNGDDRSHSLAFDAAGNVFVAGHTGSANLPMFNPGAPAYFDGTFGGKLDAFILKFNNAGTRQWATYYGSNLSDDAYKIAVDNGGNLYVTGFTLSANFQVQNMAGAYNQPAHAGGTSWGDIFVLKFDQQQARQWATFYGGSSDEYSSDIAVDALGNIYVVGSTKSSNLPSQNPGGGAYFDNTHNGGIYDAFIVEFSSSGAILWTTYYGGSGEEPWRTIIYVDDIGNIYLGGNTSSLNGMATLNPGGGAYFQGANAGATDAFIVEFNSSRSMVWATYYGGSGDDHGLDIVKNKYGTLYATGKTNSGNIQLNNPGNGAYFQGANGGGGDIFVLGFRSRSLYWGTYYGGSGNDEGYSMCTHKCVHLYMTGLTASPDFPLQNMGAGSYYQPANGGTGGDAYVVRFATDSLEAHIPTVTNVSCFGDSTGAALATSIGGIPPYTYNWNNGNITPAISGLSVGTYSVLITDFNGCTATNTVVITEPSLLTATITGSGGLCNATGTATVSASGGVTPYIYSWTNGNTQAAVSNLTAGSHTAIVTDANGCTASSSITQLATLTVTASSNVNICYGQSADLSATASGGTPAYNMQWSPGAQTTPTITVSPTVTTIYGVTITDANGCSSVQNTTVTVGTPLNAAIIGTTSLCQGNSSTLTASVSGGTNSYYYSWQPGGQTTQSITVNPSATSIYTLVATDSCSLPVMLTVTVSVNPLPEPYSVNDTDGCATLCIPYVYNASSVINSFNWNFGDGTTSTNPGPGEHCYSNPGAYNIQLTVTDNNGCSNTFAYRNVKVHSSPSAKFTYSPGYITDLDPTVYFKDQSGGATTWNWSFGDISNSGSNSQHPVFSYPEAGLYQVILIVTNIFGCSDTATNELPIIPEFVIYAPNAFTPNSDGRNDVFLPQGIGIDKDEFTLYIFDRWGNLIFESDDINIGWDGKANGGTEIAQIDTYVWKIKTKDVLNSQHFYVGHVNLIR